MRLWCAYCIYDWWLSVLIMLNYIFISQAQDFINLNWTALQDKDDEVDQFEDTLKITSRKQITRNALKLLLAAWRENLETVKFLTDKNTKNPAAAQGGSLDVLKYFINEKNCNPTCHGHCERTPFMWLLNMLILMWSSILLQRSRYNLFVRMKMDGLHYTLVVKVVVSNF